MPLLKDFGIALSQEDKSILLCVVDIEQRPSRNRIIELNKRVLELNEKGIEIIAIQASKIEQNEMDNFVKENNISLKIGMVPGDEKNVKTDWGILGLPWMILTDKEQVVIAEGFPIAELDEQINSIE